MTPASLASQGCLPLPCLCPLISIPRLTFSPFRPLGPGIPDLPLKQNRKHQDGVTASLPDTPPSFRCVHPARERNEGQLDSYYFTSSSLAQGQRKVPRCRLLQGDLLVSAPKHETQRARTVIRMPRAGHSPEGQVNHSQGSSHLHCPLLKAQDAGPRPLNYRMSRAPPKEGREQSKSSQWTEGKDQGTGEPHLLPFHSLDAWISLQGKKWFVG